MKGHREGYPWVREPLSPATRLPYWRRLFALLAHWRRVCVQRRQLAALGEATLKDLGLTRVDVEREITRRFWDDQPRR
jgi:uncharacterized protein YjiS (DUF1127 family)